MGSGTIIVCDAMVLMTLLDDTAIKQTQHNNLQVKYVLVVQGLPVRCIGGEHEVFYTWQHLTDFISLTPPQVHKHRQDDCTHARRRFQPYS